MAGTEKREAAERFIDYMLSTRFQNDIPLNMFVYPVVEDATLPEVFGQYAAVPSEAQIASVPAETVEANLSGWLDAWTKVVEQGQDPAAVR